jgi:uncharacterized protein (DUF1697 family)
LLNSGNVVFAGSHVVPERAAARIEQALAADLGVRARTIVLSAQELAAVVAENPLLGIMTNPSRLLVAVLGTARDRKKLVPLLKQEWVPRPWALAGASRMPGAHRAF